MSIIHELGMDIYLPLCNTVGDPENRSVQLEITMQNACESMGSLVIIVLRIGALLG